MKSWKGIVALLVVILVIAGLLQNLEPVRFRFWPLEPLAVPKTVLILISAAFGSLATLVLQWQWKRSRPPRPDASSPMH